ncbi:MAG: DUF6320 domain-containing protein [Sedimentibacter sp.]|uniref:DUF6320 domain-containing protein n=1 Tax=Sedimentibacter sp. TaxID=1960295 RepID=UPI0029814298|nr:DUF6320 domain-containing protein [Sedimentibacter sp.]MDW5299766.1 DUF6320 domain-containing protein [Sedimentibacter sp.]
MKYCSNCKVNIVGNRKNCPLCQEILLGDKCSDEIFPKISFVYKEHGLFFKIVLLASIVIASVSVAMNILLPQRGAWSLFILGGLGSVWASMINVINKRNNIPKNIVYQVMIISVIVILWDIITGRKGWSINYVVPLTCFFAMITMAIISKVRKLFIEDYILYIIIDGLFGIVPIIFIMTGILNVLFPSLLCIVTSIISLSTILIFEEHSLWAEAKRRLHL